MRAAAALFLALAVTGAKSGHAATAYVTDELVLGVYTAQSTQGARLATLHSGASVEALVVSGDATQVRLADGATGWVKTAYLTTQVPAVVRIKQLQDELDRSRATTPELAAAAERIEVERLTRELERLTATAPEARATTPAAAAVAPPSTAAGLRSTDVAEAAAATAPTTASGARDNARADANAGAVRPWLWMLSVILALGAGFWLGYAALARRVKYRFGGIKVY
jgi:SH3 domain protein